MQYAEQAYNPEYHDKFRALAVRKPKDVVCRWGSGCYRGVEVRNQGTSYRGDVLICSFPKEKGMGHTIGLVELYDVKPLAEFTDEDWENTRIPQEQRKKIKKGYGWCFRNPRQVIEFPVYVRRGLFNLIFTKDLIIPYPKMVIMDKESFKLINESNRKINRKGRKGKRSFLRFVQKRKNGADLLEGGAGAIPKADNGSNSDQSQEG